MTLSHRLRVLMLVPVLALIPLFAPSCRTPGQTFVAILAAGLVLNALDNNPRYHGNPTGYREHSSEYYYNGAWQRRQPNRLGAIYYYDGTWYEIARDAD